MANTNRPIKKLRVMDGAETSVLDYSDNYDVFLSHRGPDTKMDFVSHLDKALRNAAMLPFFDKCDIPRGEDSWKCIESVIKKTPIALVIFSQRFSESDWCLRELHLILESGNMVVPIFYKVKPNDLCNQEELEVRFESRFDKTIIQQWREALEKASRIGGWEYGGGDVRTGAQFVEEVVEGVCELLKERVSLNVGEYVICVEQVAKQIIRALERKKVLMLGLWGTSGIGKSTLARTLYNRVKGAYSTSYYIEDVREKVKICGVEEVQNCILKGLCRNGSWKIEGKSQGIGILEGRLQNKTFLLILDSVWDKDVMKYVITRRKVLKGSLCIVTSRDKDVFKEFSAEDSAHS